MTRETISMPHRV